MIHHIHLSKDFTKKPTEKNTTVSDGHTVELCLPVLADSQNGIGKGDLATFIGLLLPALLHANVRSSEEARN